MDIFPRSPVSRKLGEEGKHWDEEEECWDEEKECFSHFGGGNQNPTLRSGVCVWFSQPAQVDGAVPGSPTPHEHPHSHTWG